MLANMMSILLISFNLPYNPSKEAPLLSHFIDEKSEAQLANGEVGIEKFSFLFSKSFRKSGEIRHKGPAQINPIRKPPSVALQ